MSNTIHP